MINATGVLLHTNLGRAPGRPRARPPAYTNLELDLDTGRRGSPLRPRRPRCWPGRAGAEAALVVNNGAAAVLLVLAALAGGRAVAVSRGELVEIGGGFRVPEVMAQSGAPAGRGRHHQPHPAGRLRAARSTPRPTSALLLKVHQSNYRIVGFTEAVAVGELAGLGPPVVVDLGSGLLDAACPWLAGGPPAWLARRAGGPPDARRRRRARDVLGRQAARRAAGRGHRRAAPTWSTACARHPLARALRPGGLVLAALQEIALAYLAGATATPSRSGAWPPSPSTSLRAPGRRRSARGDGGRHCASVTGGGTLPGVEIPSAGVAVDGDRAAALRAARPAGHRPGRSDGARSRPAHGRPGRRRPSSAEAARRRAAAGRAASRCTSSPPPATSTTASRRSSWRSPAPTPTAWPRRRRGASPSTSASPAPTLPSGREHGVRRRARPRPLPQEHAGRRRRGRRLPVRRGRHRGLEAAVRGAPAHPRAARRRPRPGRPHQGRPGRRRPASSWPASTSPTTWPGTFLDGAEVVEVDAPTGAGRRRAAGGARPAAGGHADGRRPRPAPAVGRPVVRGPGRARS